MKHIVLSFLFLSCLGGCKKDPPILASKILIGNKNSEMEITTFNGPIHIVADASYIDEYRLDIDHDNKPDFWIASEHFTPHDDGLQGFYATIEVWNPHVQIATGTLHDSIFLCSPIQKDSLYHSTSYTIQSGFKCEGNRTSKLQLAVVQSHPTIYSKGDSINTNQNWSMDHFYLTYFDQSFTNQFPRHYNSIFIGNWNQTHLKYIVFKLDKNNEPRYGWILISIDDYNHIQLHEYALQK